MICGIIDTFHTPLQGCSPSAQHLCPDLAHANATGRYSVELLTPLSVVDSAEFLSSIRTVRYVLHFPVLFLQLPLHLEVYLAFALNPLLLHVSDHTLVHGLMSISEMVGLKSQVWSCPLTARSVSCWRCTR